MGDYRRGVAPPWSRRLVPRVLTGVGAVVVIAAYCVLAVALNRPTGARSTRVEAAAAARSNGAIKPTTTVPGAVPAILPGALHAPHFGTYDVRTETNGQKSTGTLYVGRDGSERLTIGTAKRASKLRWSTDGELVRTGEAGGDGSCTWSPAPILIATRLTEGRRWSTDASCTSTVGDDVVTIRRQETAKVTRRARTQLDGHPIDSWLIERHTITTERAGSATLVTEAASTELFAPSIGLAVYTLSRTDVPAADGSVHTVLESVELVSGAPY